jgi:hypothetical protein
VDLAAAYQRTHSLRLYNAPPTSKPIQDVREDLFVRSLHSAGPNSPWTIVGHGDGKLRYWDIARPLESYVISGSGSSRCAYLPTPLASSDMTYLSDGSVVTSETPLPTNARGGVDKPAYATAAPSSQMPVSTSHRDAVLAIATVASPMMTLVTAGRDGLVKAWV